MTINLATFRAANVARCAEAFFPLEQWTPTEWALAVVGEAGEVANAVKKLNRGDGTPEAVGAELADVVTYCDLLAARLGIDLSAALRLKFNEVSQRRGSTVTL
jgi:NTP pyrophosphatase (non-canonical NTP hydrolase)